MDEEKKVKHVRMSSNIENLVTEGKKCLLPGMDKDSVSTELFVGYHLNVVHCTNWLTGYCLKSAVFCK